MDMNLGDTQAILAECKKSGLSRQAAAYVLATARWESAHTMKPVRETLATSDDEAIRRLENAWNAGKLPWVKTPYWRRDYSGQSWLGRGYVQLTWRQNYLRAGKELGLDLITNPGNVMHPAIAKRILVGGMIGGWFTGKKLADYITPAKADYVGARRIINGTDKAAEIAKLAVQYEAALSGYDAKPAYQYPASGAGNTGAPVKPGMGAVGIIGLILAALVALLQLR